MGYRGYLTTAIFVIACWLSCHASPVEVPQPEAIENTFSLYAYGENISGLMLLYVDGKAELGDVSLTEADGVDLVYFTASGPTSDSWKAHPNSTDSSRNTESSSKNLFLAPESDTEVANVSFINADNAARQDTPSLSIYGSYVLIDSAGANFYATRSGEDGKYALGWSSGIAVQSDKIPIVLRTTAPASQLVLS